MQGPTEFAPQLGANYSRHDLALATTRHFQIHRCRPCKCKLDHLPEIRLRRGRQRTQRNKSFLPEVEGKGTVGSILHTCCETLIYCQSVAQNQEPTSTEHLAAAIGVLQP